MFIYLNIKQNLVTISSLYIHTKYALNNYNKSAFSYEPPVALFLALRNTG